MQRAHSFGWAFDSRASNGVDAVLALTVEILHYATKAALAGPVCPEASYPCIGVEQAQRENTPLLRAPCRVKAKRLTKDPKYARPPSPAFTPVLCQPDRDHAAKCDADLLKAQSPLPLGPHHNQNVALRSLVPRSVINHTERVLMVTSAGLYGPRRLLRLSPVRPVDFRRSPPPFGRDYAHPHHRI